MSADIQDQIHATELLNYFIEGNLNAILKDETTKKDGKISFKIFQTAKKINESLNILTELSNGNFSGQLPLYNQQDQIGKCITKVIESVTDTAKSASDVKMALEAEKSKLLQEDWIKSHYTKIFSKVQSSKTLHELGQSILNELAYAVNAQIGVFFIKDLDNKSENPKETKDETSSRPILNLISTYGISFENKNKLLHMGDGIIGQCAIDQIPRFINDIPDDFIQIESGIGKIKLRCIMIIPIIYENDLCGIFELASVTQFTDIQQRLIHQIASSIGISIRSIASNMLTTQLLEEIAKKNSILASQKQALDSSAIVAETDTRGRITYVNDKFLEISKYTRDELVGQDHRILNSKHHPKSFFVNLWKTIAAGEVWHGEVKNKAKDGTYYWVDTTIYPVKDERNKPIKYVAIRFDITDKKRALENLQLATEQAKNAAKVKAEFLANMSHEIRTPMNAIIGMAELLAETNLTSEQERFVAIFQRAGNSLLQIINDVLDLSKVEAGQIQLESVPFSLRNLIEDVSELIVPSAYKKDLHYFAHVFPEVPDFYCGDSFRIKQIIVNLLANAIKFTKSGEVRIEVCLNDDSLVPGNLLFIISDTGIGIPPEKVENLFQAFTQGDSSITRKYGGTGLGLSISKTFVEMMNGKIWLTSELGKGSKFFFTTNLDLAKPEAVKRLEIDPVENLQGKKILIVDNQTDNRSLLMEILGPRNIICDDAEDAAHAFHKLNDAYQAGCSFDLILLDCNMPEVDGFDFTRTIRTYNHLKSIPIIMLTSDNKSEHLALIKELEISDYLTKPVRRSDLFKAISSALFANKKDEHGSAINQNLPKSFNNDQVKPLSILLVDDSEDNRTLIISYLKHLPHLIQTAENGQFAIEKFQKEHFDIVLMDIQMPVLDGYEATRAIRKWEKQNGKIHTTIIALTAHALKDEEDKTQKAGCDLHVTKPIKKQTLISLISSLQRPETRQNVN